MSNKADQPEETNDWNYTPLPEPIPITEQVWPEGTRPLVCTRTMTYNHENYIRDCIEGILMQKTTFPVRVCIHDDASTDKTAEIVREYQEKYPNLIWAYYQKENTFRHPKRSEMRAEFMGWAEEGKYQASCEGDDYWVDEMKLEKQVLIFKKYKDVVVVGHDTDWLFEDGCSTNFRSYNIPYKNTSFKFTLADQLNGHFSHTASIVYRNGVIQKLRNKLFEILNKNYTGDIVTMYLLLSAGNGYFVNEKMCVKRKNAGGITNNKSATIKRNYGYYQVEKALLYIAPGEYKKNIYIKISQEQRVLCRKNFIEKKYLLSLVYMLKSFKNNPKWYTEKLFK